MPTKNCAKNCSKVFLSDKPKPVEAVPNGAKHADVALVAFARGCTAA